MRTAWYYLNGDDWVFNHTEAGVPEGDAPEPRFPSQKWWRSKTWQKRVEDR